MNTCLNHEISSLQHDLASGYYAGSFKSAGGPEWCGQKFAALFWCAQMGRNV